MYNLNFKDDSIVDCDLLFCVFCYTAKYALVLYMCICVSIDMSLTNNT